MNKMTNPIIKRGQARILQLPNILTIGRITVVPLIVACLLIDGTAARWTALALFICAALTDYGDGYLARRLSLHSAFGTMLDPIADKLLVSALLIMLVGDGTISGVHMVAAVIILAREILISGLREYLAGVKFEMPVSWMAKWKTATQLIALAFLLFTLPGNTETNPLAVVGTGLLWVAALLTLTTGYNYMKLGMARVIAEDDQ